jgi:hypothetical protein
MKTLITFSNHLLAPITLTLLSHSCQSVKTIPERRVPSEKRAFATAHGNVRPSWAIVYT